MVNIVQMELVSGNRLVGGNRAEVRDRSESSALRFLAFYLPQFHPIPENDEWWGPGFTEWTNVTRGQPLVRGHYQPHLPADLGFYDLRLPEARAAQAGLAKEYGIDGFCYYHYWFEGRRVLERPFTEVLHSGEPDLPFCLCWANEDWTRSWNGRNGVVLIRQTYSETDDLAHIRSLADAFCDRRYLRVRGRPVFLVYRAESLPDPLRTTETWRRESERLGAGEPYLCLVHSFDCPDPRSLGFDAAVKFAPDWGALDRQPGAGLVRRGFRKVFRPASPYRIHKIRDYPTAVAAALGDPVAEYPLYPCVSPGFDNTPRRADKGGLVLLNSTPTEYERWLRGVADRFAPFGEDEDLVFVNAWNEWAEGNHLEPCQHWGRAYLEAHARVARDHRPESTAAGSSPARRPAAAAGLA